MVGKSYKRKGTILIIFWQSFVLWHYIIRVKNFYIKVAMFYLLYLRLGLAEISCTFVFLSSFTRKFQSSFLLFSLGQDCFLLPAHPPSDPYGSSNRSKTLILGSNLTRYGLPSQTNNNVFLIKLDWVATLIANPFRCNSTTRHHQPILYSPL